MFIIIGNTYEQFLKLLRNLEIKTTLFNFIIFNIRWYYMVTLSYVPFQLDQFESRGSYRGRLRMYNSFLSTKVYARTGITKRPLFIPLKWNIKDDLDKCKCWMLFQRHKRNNIILLHLCKTISSIFTFMTTHHVFYRSVPQMP